METPKVDSTVDLDSLDDGGDTPRNSPHRSLRSKVARTFFGFAASCCRNPVLYAYKTLGGTVTPLIKAARDKEIARVRSYGTYELQRLPEGRRSVKSGFVDSVKRGLDGKLAEQRARWVAHGFSMVEGVDYDQTFAPVAKACTIRMVASIANSLGWEINQEDVDAAYLEAEMEDEVYVDQPVGYEEFPFGPDVKAVCRLLKALPGTKQVGRAWRKTVVAWMLAHGFRVCVFDHCVFIRGTIGGNDIFIVVVWVDRPKVRKIHTQDVPRRLTDPVFDQGNGAGQTIRRHASYSRLEKGGVVILPTAGSGGDVRALQFFAHDDSNYANQPPADSFESRGRGKSDAATISQCCWMLDAPNSVVAAGLEFCGRNVEQVQQQPE